MKLKTPYKDLVPPMSTVEFDALKADIKTHGVLIPIAIDEDGNILDGHHRYKCDANAKTVTINGLTDNEKQAFVIRNAVNRRNLSPDQKRELQKRQKELAHQLRLEDAKKWTQAKLAVTLGVDQATLSRWLDATNMQTHNGCPPKPDARVKLSPPAKVNVVEQLASGKSQTQVAADFGVTRQAVAKIASTANATHKRDDDKARKVAKLVSQVADVRKGDFRKVLKDVAGASLVLTDPPYPKASLPLWRDLGKWAADALADDGILVAYSGQMYLPDVLAMLGESLTYWWCLAVVHKGSGNLTPLGQPVRKVVNQWKPIVAFTKKGGVGFQRTFHDLVTGAGPQKENHNWQQPIAEASEIIERFTKKGELVVDPFAGSGGFLKAAKDLGRKAIGAEIL